jgi:hypothetical protein
MVRGLFPRAEQDAVLAALEQSLVFITKANIERLIRECAFDNSAWTLANLYLASLGAELLAKDAPHLVGLSEEISCYVSPEYFTEDAFALRKYERAVGVLDLRASIPGVQRGSHEAGLDG